MRGMSAGIGPELLDYFPGPAAEEGNADRGNACQTDDEKHCQNHCKDRHNDTSFLSLGDIQYPHHNEDLAKSKTGKNYCYDKYFFSQNPVLY